MSVEENIRPLEINRYKDHDIQVRWSNGEEIVYPARYLRGKCPCAQCVDEMTGKRIVTESILPILVYPTKIESVGRYAIQIYWSDGHSSGIFTWERLYELSRKLSASSS